MRVFLYPLVLLFAVACSHYPAQVCETKYLFVGDSPDGKVKAIVFDSDCENVSDTSISFSFLKQGEKLDLSGSIIQMADEEFPAKMGWQDNDTFVIYHKDNDGTSKLLFENGEPIDMSFISK